MFKILEELQQRYPIGSPYNSYWIPVSMWCPTETDFQIFKKRYPNAYDFEQSENCIITAKEKYVNLVEGYIFDGEYWYPAYRNWDGWQTIDEEDCNE